MGTQLDYLLSQGWTPIAAAGILGNAAIESGGNASAIGDGGLAHGLFQTHTQWHPGYSRDFNSQQQLAFASNELQTSYPGLASKLNSATSVDQATALFMSGYEKPASGASLGARINAAKGILNGAGNIISNAKNALNSDLGRAGLAVATGGASVPVFAVTDALGVTGKPSMLDQFKAWLANSHFWQRIGLGFMALLFIGAAFYLFGTGKLAKIVKEN